MSKHDTSKATQPHLSRRSFLRRAGQFGMGAAGLSLLAACGSSPAAPAAPAADQPTAAPAAPAANSGAAAGAPATISMLGWGSPLEKENVDKGLQQFQSQNPDVKVDWLHTPQDYPTKLKTMLAGGTPPDVFWANNVLDYVARGVVMDVTDRVKSDGNLGKPNYFLEPQESDRATLNGKWYGIGSCWVVPHLYYNTEMLEKAGVEPPSSDPAKAWTWEEFVANAKKLTIDASGKHPGDAGFDANNVQQWGVSWANWWLLRDVLVFSNGGDAFTDDFKIKLGEPAAVEAIQALADLAVKHQVAPQTAVAEQLGISSQQMLASGKLAILADGSWALQDIAKLGFKYGCGVLPKLKTATTAGTAHLHVIHKDTKSPDAAWKLLAYLSSDDYQRGLCKVGLWLPSHTSLLTEQGLSTWITPGVHPEGYKQIATEYLTKNTRYYYQPAGFEEANQLITTALDPVWIGQKTAAEALTADLIKQAEDVVGKASEKLK
ncbi:MAG TPA: sugar ABC transporter substrate-binding protein [Roseiflexaceae bacterium]|nr:sugar ABC transporter substrate-binding protein [Roseiflexaceae bacterium]